MRALFLPELKNNTSDEVLIDDTHHLLNVVRIKEQEEILLLDGCGLKAQGTIAAISKKQIKIKIKTKSFEEPGLNLQLAACIVKKEAMEDILRISAEIGISAVYPLQSQFSWHQFLPDSRVMAILGNALEQSNNPHLPKVAAPMKIRDFDFTKFDHVFYFTSNPQAPTKSNPQKLDIKQNILFLIGPEGGLSQEEEGVLFSYQNFSFVNFPSPILRSPTAVSVASGFIFSKLTKI